MTMASNNGYNAFIAGKSQLANANGFEPIWLPDFLFDFQAALVEWAVRQGRAAIFADCGLGKSPMELVWAENVVRKTNGLVLVLTPLAVGQQLEAEARKFGIEVARSKDGKPKADITITNYEQLHKFNPDYFTGVVCDESSAIKAFDGVRRRLVTQFLRKMPYRLLGTATAAPNDYVELGTASEALGHLGYMDMLSRFFTNREKTMRGRTGRWQATGAEKWRFKGHAETPFWQWVASWARAVRRPSDLGYKDDGFVLPPLHEHEHIVKARVPQEGTLFAMPASGLREEREEQRRTIRERVEYAATLMDGPEPVVAWCQLNAESEQLADATNGIEVRGSDSPEAKEEALVAFSRGEIRALITKPAIGAWGLNWQHCNRMVYYVNHSYEQHYQAVRRCWRFGQKRPVTVDLIATEGGLAALKSIQRKSKQAERMFEELISHMNEGMRIDRLRAGNATVKIPSWL